MITISHTKSKNHRVVEIDGDRYWLVSPVEEHTYHIEVFGRSYHLLTRLKHNVTGNDLKKIE